MKRTTTRTAYITNRRHGYGHIMHKRAKALRVTVDAFKNSFDEEAPLSTMQTWKSPATCRHFTTACLGATGIPPNITV